MSIGMCVCVCEYVSLVGYRLKQIFAERWYEHGAIKHQNVPPPSTNTQFLISWSQRLAAPLSSGVTLMHS